ncbi:hypothetical protein [Nonomuraea helvata]|uniref:Uncharacterized protein n=1 Tax=Nonomuraea helvata TaxID=37484 RepID=A0ABV5S3R3_9ACTN
MNVGGSTSERVAAMDLELAVELLARMGGAPASILLTRMAPEPVDGLLGNMDETRANELRATARGEADQHRG